MPKVDPRLANPEVLALAAVRLKARGHVVRYVAWEDRIEDMDLQPVGIILSIKFETSEEWSRAMRQRFGFLMDGPPDDNLDERPRQST